MECCCQPCMRIDVLTFPLLCRFGNKTLELTLKAMHGLRTSNGPEELTAALKDLALELMYVKTYHSFSVDGASLKHLPDATLCPTHHTRPASISYCQHHAFVHSCATSAVSCQHVQCRSCNSLDIGIAGWV